MTPKAFIEERLSQLRALENAPLPAAEERTDAIMKALMSKKFRKYATPESHQKRMRSVIERHVRAGTPIKFLWPFGAYKLWRFEEAPEPDWAELFTLMYLTRWLNPVAAMHKPGVHLNFSSDEVIVERLNNIPANDTDKYAEVFSALFAFLRPYAPENLTYSLTPMRSHYEDGDFEAQLAEQIKRDQAEYEGGYPKLTEAKLRKMELNVRIKPGQTDDPLWREKNALIHDAYIHLTNKYLCEPDTVGVFSTPLNLDNFIAVGTTKTSIVRYWVGVGALLKREDSLIETILSPSQLEKTLCEEEPISLEGLSGKNFHKIRIVGG
ncbi:MAG: hypothetical protein NUV59_00430 [Patescibacteria group bacterium]|nr:hypothetical protein [Patescibacteria group bacterium]